MFKFSIKNIWDEDDLLNTKPQITNRNFLMEEGLR